MWDDFLIWIGWKPEPTMTVAQAVQEVLAGRMTVARAAAAARVSVATMQGQVAVARQLALNAARGGFMLMSWPILVGGLVVMGSVAAGTWMYINWGKPSSSPVQSGPKMTTDRSKPGSSVSPPGTRIGPDVVTPPLADFGGKWQTGVGRFSFPKELKITQTGDAVTGDYSYRDGEQVHTGSIKGKVTGNTLNFTWKGPENGGKGGKGQLTLSRDGKTFSGSYTGEPSRPGGNPWHGTRKN